MADPFDACNDSGPLQNADEIAGNIVLVGRGTCAFVEKVTNVSAAGAAAVIVANCDPSLSTCPATDPDAIILQAGECAPEVCTAPDAGVSFNTGLALQEAITSGAEAPHPTDQTCS